MPAVAQAAPGDLDPSFGEHGVAAQPAALESGPIVTTDGGAVFLVRGDSPAIVKVTNSGAPDGAFGDGGRVALSEDAFDSASLAVGPGGDLYVAGTKDQFSQDPTVVVERFSPNGTRDEEYNGAIDYPATPPENPSWERASGIAVDGEDVLVGLTVDHGLQVTLVRLDSSGALDTSFGGDGFTDPIDGFGAIVRVDNDDYLLGTADEYSNEVTLARYDQTGDPKTSFGTGGEVTLPGNRLGDLALGPDGRIALVFGSVNPLSKSERPARVSAFTRDGAPLPGFDASDPLLENERTERAFFVSALTYDGQGRILVAGAWQPRSIYASGSDPMLGRLKPDGSIDRGFGESGFSRFPQRAIGLSELGLVTTDVAGRILAGADSALARFKSSRGRADADADAKPDRDDGCPRVYSKRKDGCPRFRVEIDAEPAEHGLTGTMHGERGCFVSRRDNGDRIGGRILVRRHARGADPRVGRARIKTKDLTWEFDGIKRPGRYYAQLPRSLNPTLGICLAAKSKPVRIG